MNGKFLYPSDPTTETPPFVAGQEVIVLKKKYATQRTFGTVSDVRYDKVDGWRVMVAFQIFRGTGYEPMPAGDLEAVK